MPEVSMGSAHAGSERASQRPPAQRGHTEEQANLETLTRALGENARLQADLHRLFATRLLEFRNSQRALQDSVGNLENRLGRMSPPASSSHFPAVPVGDNLLLMKVLNRFLMYLEATDMSLTPHLVADGCWEKNITEAFTARLKPGMTVVDVGANYGYYTLLAASHVGWDGRALTAGHVYAFEPHPRTFEVLTKNIHVNHLQSLVRAYPAAAWDSHKQIRFHQLQKFTGESSPFEPVGRPEHDCSPDQCPTINAVALDDVIQESVDLMKIDAEGSEPLVFRGMRGILDRSPNLTIFLEFFAPMIKQTVDPRLFLQEIRDLGFAMQWFTPWGTLERFDQEQALQYSRFDLLLERPRATSEGTPTKPHTLEARVPESTPSQEESATPLSVSTSSAEAFLPNRFEVVNCAPVWMTMSERVLLYGLIAGLRPRRCLEVGTFKGGSALIIAAALDDLGDGRLACVDPNAQIQPEHWQSIAHRATLFQAPSPDVLPQASLAVGGKFDFALIDGDHSTEGVIRDIQGVIPHLENEAYLLFHDAHNSEVIEGINRCLREPANSLTDCGVLSREKTPDAAPGIFWGGLRLLRFCRNSRT
jgi:FkbM family methyltransferase